MESLKSRFEKDLKNKLLFKTSPHMTEEILLLKNFKYFDEDNTDKCDIDTFLKVIAKVGVLSFGEQDLKQLFNYYAQGQQYLDYKDFIGQVFDNESLKHRAQQGSESKNRGKPNKNEEYEQPQQEYEPESEALPPQNENEELDPIDELILRVRNRLSQRGISNLINLEARCRELDENNEQELDIKMFAQICHEFDFGLTEDDIDELFLSFDKEERGMVNYDDFIRILRGELNDKRKDLVQNVFKHLDVNNKGALTVDELLDLYNPRQSLEFVRQHKSEEEAFKIFEDSLIGNHKYLNGDEGDTKPVDIEEFEDFYESLSLMIPSDELFRDVVLRTWGLIKDEPKEEENEEQQNEREDENLPQQNYEREPEQEQEEMPQEEQEERYVPQVKKERKEDKEREFRRNVLNEENLDIFRNKLGARGIVVLMNFVNQCYQYDRSGNKELVFNDFKEIINNAKVIMSDDEIYDLFNDFADKNLLNYEKFLQNLVGNLNPRRLNIVKEAFKKLDPENCGVVDLSDIKELFNSKNCPLVNEAMMSEETFYRGFMETFQTHHNIFRSPKIKKVNYPEFEDYYKYVSITVDDDYLFEETVISSWKLSKSPMAHKGPKDNIKEIIANPKLQIPDNEEVKKANKISKRCFPQKNKAVPYGVDNEVTDYSNQLHPTGSLSGKKLSKNDDILTFFRKKIVARGLRGIMSLRRTFMLYDETKSNKLKRKEFHKFLDDYRFNIAPNVEKELFDTFDHNKSGTINYNEFIRALIGKMNDFRTQIVEEVFDKLDKERKRRVPYDVIRDSYNVDKHPEVLNGKRTKQEVLSRFIDLFEYHFNLLNSNKDADSASLQDFIEFYNFISIFIDNDKYFENLMARVWGLGNTENYGKVIHFVKYKSPYI